MPSTLYSELLNLTGEDPFSRYFTTDMQRDVVALLLEKCINEKNIRITGINYFELKKYFRNKGYSEKDLFRTLDELEIHLRRERTILDENGKKIVMSVYTPAISVRHVAYKFLERHPEITDVKDDFGPNPSIEIYESHF